MIAFLKFMEVISTSNKKLSELVKEFKIYQKTYIPSIKVTDKEKVFNLLKEKYVDASKLDEKKHFELLYLLVVGEETRELVAGQI